MSAVDIQQMDNIEVQWGEDMQGDEAIDVDAAKEEKQYLTFQAHHLPITDIQVTDDGTIFTASSDHTIKIWSWDDEDKYILKKTLKKHSHVVSEIALSSDNSHFVSSSYDKTINLWDLNKVEQPNRFIGHSKAVLSVAVSADNRVIISGGADKKTMVWNVQGTLKIEDESHKGFVNQVDFNPFFQNIFFSCSEDKGIIGYNHEKQGIVQPYAKIYGHGKPVLGFCQSPDGSLLGAITHTDIFFHDVVMGDFCASTKLPAYQKISHNQQIMSTGTCLKFNPHAILIAYSCGQQICLNTLNSGDQKWLSINDGAYSDHDKVSATFTKFVWTKDGKNLVTGASDGAVRIIKCHDLIQ